MVRNNRWTQIAIAALILAFTATGSAAAAITFARPANVTVTLRPVAAASSKASAPPAVTAKPIASATAAPAPAAPAPAAPAPAYSNPTAVVAQFYQDITDHDYAAAWSLGGQNLSGGTGYTAWVAGYATTASIYLSTYGTWSNGTVWANITATQSDGSVRPYYGTYTVSDGVIVAANIAQN